MTESRTSHHSAVGRHPGSDKGVGPDDFIAWAADDGNGRGSSGVTAQIGRAATLLVSALAALPPGASGSIKVVRLDRLAPSPSYVYRRTLIQAHRDSATGVVVLAGGGA